MRHRTLILSSLAILAVSAGTAGALGGDPAPTVSPPCRFTLERGADGTDGDGRPVENWVVTCHSGLQMAKGGEGLPTRRVVRPE